MPPIPFNTSVPAGTTVNLPARTWTGPDGGTYTMPARTVTLPTNVFLPGGRLGFLIWIRTAHPEVHQYILQHFPQYANDREKYLSWLQQNRPRVYAELQQLVPAFGLGDLPAQIDFTNLPTADDTGTSVDSPSNQAVDSSSPSFTTVVSGLANALVQGYSQKKVLDVQLARAQQGLPPLDTAYLSDSTSLKAGVDQSTQRTLLMLGGLVVGGLVLSTVLKRR